jgi:hypothetical protein
MPTRTTCSSPASGTSIRRASRSRRTSTWRRRSVRSRTG